ncbi:MAG: 3-methyl-2-oxobutanoate hydroxymethyltransferase [Chlamydiae bacterium]|nr:3-methyl-2-oxobutanoate hydroxymethyltransferase [Chlamydiota bacterium]MBI3265791.1 3-methyl-2-oxobutanoate hydroxymethyltransferase [Chlamydiota bacterium]
MSLKTKVTLEILKLKKKAHEKIVALTAYDYGTAKILDEVGTDLILVGDSLGMVVLGYSSTLPVTLDDMIHHTRAVARGVRKSLLVADMPFSSYGISHEDTLRNAARFIQEAHAQAVKLEGGRTLADVIQKMVSVGIPVLGHLGMLPTHVIAQSGYHVQGRDVRQQKEMIEDALVLQDAGVFGLVLECVPTTLAREITEKLEIPTLGIGAGSDCDGQILVSHDLLGLYEGMKPKFVKQYAHLAQTMREAFKSYADDVKKGKFPSKEHIYS